MNKMKTVNSFPVKYLSITDLVSQLNMLQCYWLIWVNKKYTYKCLMRPGFDFFLYKEDEQIKRFVKKKAENLS